MIAQEVDAEESLQEKIDRIESELLWRRADIVQGRRWSLFDHLRDVLDVLEAWEQPARVKLAGYLYCAYGLPENAALALFARDERDVVIDLVGADAERLLEAFASMTLEHVLEAANATGGDGSATSSPRDLGDLLVLHLAVLSQTCESNGAPAEWLATASHVASCARTLAEVPPPVFERGTVRVTADDERLLIDRYASLLRRPFGSHHGEAAALDEICRTVPSAGEPLIWLGLFALAAGDVAAASGYGKRGAAALTTWNTAWDKRLSGLQWIGLADFLETAAPLEGAEREFLARRTAAILESAARPDGVFAQLEGQGALGEPQLSLPTKDEELPDALEDDAHDWTEFGLLPSRFSQYIAGFRENDEAGLGMYPGLVARPWWDPNEFTLVSELEGLADDVIAEYARLDPRLWHRSDGRTNRIGDASIFMLIDRGRKNESNAALCPITTKFVEAQHGARGLGGTAYFVRFGPGAKVGARRSWTNTRLRCQLGLTTSASVITVDGTAERVRQKRCLVFDDSFRHEEQNSGERESALFVLDLWHPDLRPDEISLIEGLNRAIALSANALQRRWAENDAPRMSA